MLSEYFFQKQIFFPSNLLTEMFSNKKPCPPPLFKLNGRSLKMELALHLLCLTIICLIILVINYQRLFQLFCIHTYKQTNRHTYTTDNITSSPELAEVKTIDQFATSIINTIYYKEFVQPNCYYDNKYTSHSNTLG